MDNIVINKITLTNFKSFKNSSIKLNKFNVFIGANASGKSNFLSFFKFLRDVIQVGLDDAISIQGGAEYLVNCHHETKEFGFKIEFTLNTNYGFSIENLKKKNVGALPKILLENDKRDIKIAFLKGSYEVSILLLNDSHIEITKDKFISDSQISIFDFELDKNERPGEIPLGKFKKIIERTKNKFKTKFISKDNPELSKILSDYSDLQSLTSLERESTPKRILIEHMPFFNPEILEIYSFFQKEFTIFDIDPKKAKYGIPFSGTKRLSPDGRNLAIVMKRILDNPKKEKDYKNLINDILPFINDLDVVGAAGNRFVFSIKEIYGDNNYLSTFLSDGTINIIAIITALFFERQSLKIFEEPERNIHPQLISQLLEYFREASEKSQIIITTHNPQFVKYAELEEIVLIRRDEEEGLSSLDRTVNSKMIKEFLKNDLGLDDLFIRGLM